MEIDVDLKALQVKWKVPSEQQLRLEYEIEYKMKRLDVVYRDPFPTAEEFVKAVKASPKFQVDPQTDRRILNRSRCRTMEQLRALVSKYRSWPEFRNDKTLKAIVDGFQGGKSMDMSIVLNHHGQMRVLSGNTRMDIAFMHNIYPHVIIVEV